MTVTISTEIIAAVAKWAYQDYDRPEINCVLFSAHYVVATDGHRLVRVPSENDGPDIAVGPKYLLAAVEVSKLVRDVGEGSTLTLSMTVKGVLIEIAQGVRMMVPASDATAFPPYEQVIPTDMESESPAGHYFNPAYLAAIEEVHLACGGHGRGVIVTAWAKDRLGMMKFKGAGGSEFVIMPMRP